MAGCDDERALKTPGFALRVSISIIVCFGWLIFLVMWLFFYAADYSIYQNIAVILASVLASMAVLAVSWVSWGIKYGDKFEEKKRKK